MPGVIEIHNYFTPLQDMNIHVFTNIVRKHKRAHVYEYSSYMPMRRHSTASSFVHFGSYSMGLSGPPGLAADFAGPFTARRPVLQENEPNTILSQTHVRKEFPETWLWESVNINK